MSMLRSTAGPYEFRARLEEERAPATCAAAPRPPDGDPRALERRSTVVEGHENLRALGERTLWEGAQDIVFERA